MHWLPFAWETSSVSPLPQFICSAQVQFGMAPPISLSHFDLEYFASVVSFLLCHLPLFLPSKPHSVKAPALWRLTGWLWALLSKLQYSVFLPHKLALTYPTYCGWNIWGFGKCTGLGVQRGLDLRSSIEQLFKYKQVSSLSFNFFICKTVRKLIPEHYDWLETLCLQKCLTQRIDQIHVK